MSVTSPVEALALQAGVVAGQGGDLRGEFPGAAQGHVGVAVPEPPLDPVQPALQRQGFDGAVMRQALGVLAQHGQSHGDVEPV